MKPVSKFQGELWLNNQVMAILPLIKYNRRRRRILVADAEHLFPVSPVTPVRSYLKLFDKIAPNLG
jgi:hypothetical protein